jgi:hypothetical protein
MRPLSVSIAAGLTLLIGIGAIAGSLLLVTVVAGLSNAFGPISFSPVFWLAVVGLVALGAGQFVAGIGLWSGRAWAWLLATVLHLVVLLGVAVSGANGGFSAPLVAGGGIAIAALATLLLPASREALRA